MKILYGALETWIDVSDICLQKLKRGDMIIIPFGDLTRALLFSDPCVGVHKKIVVITDTSDDNSRNEFDSGYTIHINVATGIINTINEQFAAHVVDEKLSLIQSNLSLKYGTFMEELPEQKMVARYFTGLEKVLEIGGNIGRNSLIIASILNSSNRGTNGDNMMLDFVSLESDENIANQLRENALLNNLSFHIESSALSKRRLMQQGWNTVVNDTDALPGGYKWVNTITFDQLRAKYNNIEFDTLVLDCEGAFYYILMDMPEILNSIKLIVMENDYWNALEKQYVDDTLINNGFYREYAESGGWGPCQPNFFEVWKR